MSENAEKNAVLKQTLYLVATPIGNMSDITERAVKVLSEADFIAAEDTRKTGLLLNRLGISSELISYYDHNKEEKGPKIIERIKNGESWDGTAVLAYKIDRWKQPEGNRLWSWKTLSSQAWQAGLGAVASALIAMNAELTNNHNELGKGNWF